MKNIVILIGLMLSGSLMMAQQKMTPELLWQVERVSAMGLDKEGTTLFFSVKKPNIEENNFDSKYYKMPILGGEAVEIEKEAANFVDKNISPDGIHKLFHKEVAIAAIKGTDVYKNLDKSDVYIFSDLDIRHWDTWQDGSYNHVFYKKLMQMMKQAPISCQTNLTTRHNVLLVAMKIIFGRLIAKTCTT
jgi:hypothetical protein